MPNNWQLQMYLQLVSLQIRGNDAAAEYAALCDFYNCNDATRAS